MHIANFTSTEKKSFAYKNFEKNSDHKVSRNRNWEARGEDRCLNTALQQHLG